MDHVVIPLDPDHVDALDQLRFALASAVGAPSTSEASCPHITLLAYERLPREAVRAAVESVLDATEPFVVHAHGYGFFTGVEPVDVSLHVPVVRTRAIDALHARLCDALQRGGARVAPWCEPSIWSPHITIIDRVLAPDVLGRAATWLATRHHPSWRIPVDRVAVTGGWPERDRSADVVRFGAKD